MKKKAKAISLLLSAAMAITFTACADASIVGTVDGIEIKAGEYIMAQMQVVEDAKTKFSEEHPDVNQNEETFNYFNYTLENRPFSDWMTDKAIEELRLNLAYELILNELELSVDAETMKNIKTTVRENWEYVSKEAQDVGGEASMGEYFENRGIGMASYIKIQERYLMPEAIFHYYYDSDGPEAVPEDEIKAFFKEEYARARVIAMSKKNVNDEDYNESDLEALRERGKDYVAKLEAGGGFTALNKDYDEFIQSEERRLNPENFEEEVDEEIQSDASDENTDDNSLEEVTEESEEANDVIQGEEFDELFQKGTTTYGEEVTERLFELEEGGVAMVETETAIVVIKRFDVLSRLDWIDQNKETILHELKDEDFEAKMKEKAEKINLQLNDAAIGKYDPRKVIEG